MKTFLACLTLTLLIVFALPAFADDHSTMRVVVVETDDVDAYVEQLKIGNKLIRAQDENWNMTAWQSTFSGSTTGSVIVAVQYPGGLADFAAAWEKNMMNDDITEWLEGLGDLRTIVSDSLYAEMPLN